MRTPDPKLVQLFQQMVDLTAPECALRCRLPHSCCNSYECENTAQYALETYGVTLERTKHPSLPFMGERGCTVAPYLRPLCSVHTCGISTYGCKPGDDEWTERYFNLRDELNDLL
jgi:hypothetical protein